MNTGTSGSVNSMIAADSGVDHRHPRNDQQRHDRGQARPVAGNGRNIPPGPRSPAPRRPRARRPRRHRFRSAENAIASRSRPGEARTERSRPLGARRPPFPRTTHRGAAKAITSSAKSSSRLLARAPSNPRETINASRLACASTATAVPTPSAQSSDQQRARRLRPAEQAWVDRGQRRPYSADGGRCA